MYGPLCDFLTRQVQVDGGKLLFMKFFRDSQNVNPIGAETVYSEMKSVAFYRYDAVKRTGAVIPVAPANSKVTKSVVQNL